MHFRIYSDVKESTLEAFQRAIEAEKNEVVFDICSAGGSVFTALGMIDLVRMRGLKSFANVYGWAASAAGLLAVSCDRVRMTSNGTILLHSVWSPDGEIPDDVRAYINARQLDIIHRRDPLFSMDEINKDNWLDAETCKKRGLADEIFNFMPITRGEKLVAFAARLRPFTAYKRRLAMEEKNNVAECGKDSRIEEQKEIQAAEGDGAASELVDVVEKILQRLEELDHRIAVLEGEGKKEDDEMESGDIVAHARIHKLWANYVCNAASTQPPKESVQDKQIKALEKARKTFDLKSFLK